MQQMQTVKYAFIVYFTHPCREFQDPPCDIEILHWKYQKKTHAVVFCLHKNFPIHFLHDLPADIEAQTISFFISRVASPVKTVEKAWYFLSINNAPGIADPDQLTAFLFLKRNAKQSAIPIFKSVLHEILYHFQRPVQFVFIFLFS